MHTIVYSYNNNYCSIGANGRTDPHYTTFDNQYYTYYARGPFSMARIVSPGQQNSHIFHLQGNLGPNPGWTPSWVTSMAFGVPGVFGYQVRFTV